jgi:release factor glutamine methyltransferase
VFLLRLPGVFKPHSDSLLLADHVMREVLPPGARVLDVCTGSGVLAVAAARRRGVEVYAVDISRRACLTAAFNGWIRGARIDARQGHLFEPVRDLQFDLIVSNPPYLPSKHDPPASHSRARAWDAGPTGRDLLDPLCAQVAARLRPGGVLLLTHSTVCGEQETIDALRAGGLKTSVVTRVPGPLGSRLRSRAAWLREQGLIGDEPVEDVLIIRAVKPLRARTPVPTRASEPVVPAGVSEQGAEQRAVDGIAELHTRPRLEGDRPAKSA